MMEYLELFKTIAATLFTGAGIGLMAYFSKAQKGEAFEPLKLAKTGFIGAVVGLIMYLSGQKVDANNYQVYIAANAGVIYMIDKLWSFLRNAFRARVSGVVPHLIIVFMVLLVSSGCASFGERVTPQTDGEKLAYAEATLTGLTVMATQLNNARLIPLDKIKDIENGINSAELAIRLGRVALMGKDNKTALAQLATATGLLKELTIFIEEKRAEFLANIPKMVEVGGGPGGIDDPIPNEYLEEVEVIQKTIKSADMPSNMKGVVE